MDLLETLAAKDAEIARLQEQVAGYQRLVTSAHEMVAETMRDSLRDRRRLAGASERLREIESSVSQFGVSPHSAGWMIQELRAALAAAEGKDGT